MAEAFRGSFHAGAGPETDVLYDGAREAIEALDAAGYLLAVTTGKGQRGLRAVLGVHGLLDHFVSLQSADLVPGKPDPTMLHRALNESGVKAARVVMVSDTLFDMQMARNAGMANIAVGWGYHENHVLEAFGPDAMIRHFGELSATVESLLCD